MKHECPDFPALPASTYSDTWAWSVSFWHRTHLYLSSKCVCTTCTNSSQLLLNAGGSTSPLLSHIAQFIGGRLDFFFLCSFSPLPVLSLFLPAFTISVSLVYRQFRCPILLYSGMDHPLHHVTGPAHYWIRCPEVGKAASPHGLFCNITNLKSF